MGEHVSQNLDILGAHEIVDQINRIPRPNTAAPTFLFLICASALVLPSPPLDLEAKSAAEEENDRVWTLETTAGEEGFVATN